MQSERKVPLGCAEADNPRLDVIIDPTSSVSDFFREWGKLLRSGGKEVSWSKTLGRFRFSYRRRSRNMHMGRFGGGWNWKLGVSVGGSTVVFDALIFSMRIDRVKEVANDAV